MFVSLAIIILVCVCVVVTFVVCIYFYSRVVKRGNTSNGNDVGSLARSAAKDNGGHTACNKKTRPFSFEEVKVATRDFSNKIGEGRFGPVYYGRLKDGQEVAVKVRSASYCQGEQDGHLVSEVHILAKVHHQYLVSLLGYCLDPSNQILIYECMRNGTLRENLHHGATQIQSPLKWRTRLRVVLDAARGLHSLHTDWIPTIIHRDVNSINVMLDENMNGRIADFGISKISLDDDSGIPTILKCTVGYLDPEYFTTQRLTPKSDVYSFGVVLLEIICGRAAISHSAEGNHWTCLVDWVRSVWKSENENVEAIIDPSVRQEQYCEESVLKLAILAMACLDPSGSRRPDMGTVVKELAEALLMEDMYHERLATAAPPPVTHERTASVDSTASNGTRDSTSIDFTGLRDL